MFKKFQLKMVLLNIAVVAFVFVIILGMQFYLTSNILRRQANGIKNRIESEWKTDDIEGNKKLYDSMILGSRMIVIGISDDGIVFTKNDKQFMQEPGLMDEFMNLIYRDIPDMRYVHFDDRVYFTFNSRYEDTVYYYFLDATQERALTARVMLNTALIGMVAIVMIITASLFLTNKALVPIKIAWKKQKRFVADASHELRTPVAVIRTNMEVLDEDENATIGSQRQWIDNVNEETKRMTGLIENLLYLSRMDLTGKSTTRESSMFHEAVESAVEKVAVLAGRKGLAIEASYEPVRVRIPVFEIKRLTVILIENALKYTDAGFIRISVKNEDNMAVLVVSDSGLGIENGELGKIFDRFYRVDESREKKTGGHGLGLSIARSITDSYNGRISVESEPGKGSTFTVSFPAVK